MTEPRPMFRRTRKIGDLEAGLMIRGFVLGCPIRTCAEGTGVSERTVRETYRDLRARLLRPAFRRWGPRDVLFGDLKEAERHEDRWRDLLARIAGCMARSRCWNDFVSGKRSSRNCRSCPILDFDVVAHFEATRAELADDIAAAQQDFLGTAYDLMDDARAFYDRLGWREPVTAATDVSIIEQRVFHAHALQKCANLTRLSSDGENFDLHDDGFQTFGTLLTLLAQDLMDDPL